MRGQKKPPETDQPGLASREPAAAARLLPRSFYAAPPALVACRLLGKLLVHRVGPGDGAVGGRIVEVEAYLGPHNDPPDPAAHAYRGPTPRNRVLFGPAGHAYVYSIYGLYYCLNIACEEQGQAGCVLLRALEPLFGFETMARNRRLPASFLSAGTLPPVRMRQLTAGPSRLCQALGIERTAHNGLDVTSAESPLQVRDDGLRVREAMATARIGIKEAADWPLRFVLPGHACLSGPRRLGGLRVPVE